MSLYFPSYNGGPEAWTTTTGLPPGQTFGKRDGYTHGLHGSRPARGSAAPAGQARPVQPQGQGSPYGVYAGGSPRFNKRTGSYDRPAAPPKGDGSNFRGYQNDMRALNTWGRGGDPSQNYWQPSGQQPTSQPSQSQGGYGSAYSYTAPGMSFGSGSPTQSNAGNAANSPMNRPPPFTSQMTDGYGNQTSTDQFYGQQQAMIGNLLQRLGQQNQGTYLGPGNPPPSFFAPPQFDMQAMWGQAGQQPSAERGRFMATPAAPSEQSFVNPWFNSQANQSAVAAGRKGWF